MFRYKLPAEKTTTFSIGKATHSNQTANGSAKFGASGTADLSALIVDGGTVGEITKADAENVLNGEPSVAAGNPAFTKITASGKTLADASLAKGTITADGTLSWDDGNSTTVEQGKAYGWTFTPTDTANYNVKTGTLIPWAKPASGGGSSGCNAGSFGLLPLLVFSLGLFAVKNRKR